MSKALERGMLITVLVAFFLLSATYSVVVPPFEASDELWHYPMVRHIAENGSLPVQDPANVGPWRQEGSQPPLYYALGALATFWIDTSDVAEVRHLNPHVDNGIATPDGNVNMVVHRPGREAFPWHGTVLALHIVRFLSAAMATVGVALTYMVVKEVFPGRTGLAVGATAIHAFTPMVAFIAGSVNNDNLVVPISSLALLMLLRLLREEIGTQEGRWRSTIVWYLLLGFLLGLAALTKASSLALALLTALVVTVRAVRRRSECPVAAWTEFLAGGFATLLPLLAVAGWWYLRNLRLYGDLTGLNAFIRILGQREVHAGLVQLWRERYSFLASFWGNFGGLNVPMPEWVYTVLNGTLIVAAVGLVLEGIRWLVLGPVKGKAAGAPRPSQSRASPPAGGVGRRNAPDGRRSNLAFVLLFLWGLGVFLPWIQWARVTWSSQGRLIFAALPVWSSLIALGLSAYWPRGQRSSIRPVPAPPVLLLGLFLLGLSAAAPFVWIQPAYARPTPLSDTRVASIPQREDVTFDNTMRLLGHEPVTGSTQPDGQVEITLYWEALGPTKEDHTVFVHVLGEHELVVAQRDTFPGLGTLSTTWLEPGFRWADRYVVPIPATAYAPNQARIQIGIFNTQTGERMMAVDETGEALGDNVRFGRIEIEPRSGNVPNPISIDFGGRMLLTGYELSTRAAYPGDTVTLTLFWEAQRPMESNYTVSTQLIDGSQTKAAQNDRWPVDGAAPTSAWEPGSTITDSIPLPIFPDAVEGPYAIRVAVYSHEDHGIQHLPVTPPGGRMQATHVRLTELRVLR